MFKFWLKMRYKSYRIALLIVLLVVLFCTAIYNNHRLYSMKQRNELNAAVKLIEEIKLSEPSKETVPNIVHYIYFDNFVVDFFGYLSVISVIKNHQPEEVIIWCNCENLLGKYWDKLQKEYSDQIKLLYYEKPTEVFGQSLDKNFGVYHAGDIAKVRITLEHGGIYLDNDVFVVQSLNRYFDRECTMAWNTVAQWTESQVVIAKKNSRYLQHWLNCYRYYCGNLWHFNAGDFPSIFSIASDVLVLNKVDHSTFGQRLYDDDILYNANDGRWLGYLTFHLWKTVGSKDRNDRRNPLYQQGLLGVDEIAIKKLNTSFGQMCRSVLYNTTDLIL